MLKQSGKGKRSDICFASPVSIRHFGGAEKWIVNIANLFSKEGYKTSIKALPYLHGTERINLNEIKAMLSGVDYSETWFPVIDSDVVYLYYQPFIWRLFRIKGKKIAGLHAPGIFYGQTIRRTLFNLLGEWDLRSFDSIHILNRTFKDIISSKNVFYIPNWIDTDFFRPIGKKADVFTVLFVGRQIKEKGWDIFLQLASDLEYSGYNFEFLCTGKGMKNVKGLGFVKEENLPELYHKAHLVVYPSIMDIFSLVIIEALSCETPVITTPIPVHKNMDLPLLYAQKKDDFIQKILMMHKKWEKEPDKYKDICTFSRESILKRYDIKYIVPRLKKRLLEKV